MLFNINSYTDNKNSNYKFSNQSKNKGFRAHVHFLLIYQPTNKKTIVVSKFDISTKTLKRSSGGMNNEAQKTPNVIWESAIRAFAQYWISFWENFIFIMVNNSNIRFSQQGFLKLSKNALVSCLIVTTIFVGTGIIFLFNPFGGGVKEAEAAWPALSTSTALSINSAEGFNDKQSLWLRLKQSLRDESLNWGFIILDGVNYV